MSMTMHLQAESAPHRCLSTQLDASEFRAALLGVTNISRRDLANLFRDVTGDGMFSAHQTTIRQPSSSSPDTETSDPTAATWTFAIGCCIPRCAVVARAPKQRSLQRTEGVSLTEDELRQLMRTAAGHRLFPLYWLTAMTGMRRSEVLGLKWPDIDFTKRRLHLNRGLVAVGYKVHETRGKTKTARRAIALDDTTSTILAGWRAFQTAEFAGKPVHPHAVYEAFRRIVHNAGIPTIRFS